MLDHTADHEDASPSLLGELLGESPKPAVATNLQRRLRYTHEAMIDQIIACPGITQNQLASLFGYSAAWVSTIMASDSFQAKLSERRTELIDPQLSLTIKDRLNGIATESLRILAEKLSAPVVTDNLAIRAAEMATRSLGLGITDKPPDQKSMEAYLQGLGENLTKLLSQKRAEAVEGIVITEIVEDGQESQAKQTNSKA